MIGTRGARRRSVKRVASIVRALRRMRSKAKAISMNQGFNEERSASLWPEGEARSDLAGPQPRLRRGRRLGSPLAWMAALVLAATLAWTAWRATLEGATWCDELFSIMLARHPLGEIVDLTAVDNHPPLYYFVLKGWIALGVAAGLAPGTLWARLPGLIGWLGAVFVAWRVGRRTLGGDGGWLLALGMACAPQALWGVRNIRGYATAVPALEICFLLMFGMSEAARRETAKRRHAVVGWTLYGVAASVALWSHLLAGVVVFVLGLWWAIEVAALARREGAGRAWRSSLAIGGLAAQGVVALGFAPWLAEYRNQVGNLIGARRDWMTPPTLVNYLKVFALWYPWGGHEGMEGLPPAAFWSWASAIGCVTVLAPAGGVLWAWRCWRRGRGDAAQSEGAATGAARRLAMAGCGVAMANVAIQWVVDRLGIQFIFHGPRYPIFTNAMWGAGLAGLAIWAAALGARRVGGVLAWALLAPWVAVNWTGMAIDSLRERQSNIVKAVASPELRMPPPGAALFVLPGELTPYFKRALSSWKVMPIEDLARVPDGASGIHFFLITSIPTFDLEQEAALTAFIGSGKLGHAEIFRPADNHNYLSARVDGFRAAGARELAEAGYRARAVPAPPGTLELSAPSQWRQRDGWNATEIDGGLNPYRWTIAPTAKIRLARPIGPGRVIVRLQGALPTLRDKPTPALKIAIEGEPGSAFIESPGGGAFDCAVELTPARRHPSPTIDFDYPTFRPSDMNMATGDDRRARGFALHMAAIVAAPEGGDASGAPNGARGQDR
jgi:hypothetical protein